MRTQYIEVPLVINHGKKRILLQKALGACLTPFYLAAAMILKTPGVKIHLKCAVLGIRLFLSHRISLETCYSLIFHPMDSTRYFEFHEVLMSLSDFPFNRYLDVSSPRIAPIMLLLTNKEAVAEMINPDIQDIKETKYFIKALRLGNRCKLVNKTIEMVEYPKDSFDIITCISVLEHIPSDKNALEIMWSLLRPGGRFILTLPCMSQPLEQYISYNSYGILSPEDDGYTFWQRYYDDSRLHSVVFSITGLPMRMVLYGERSNGLFYRNASMKRLLGSLYPFWRESYMMGKEYCKFKKLSELPGEGVAVMEFVKS